MKALFAIIALVAFVIMSAEGTRAYINDNTAKATQATQVARAVAQDARLADACAKGQTGVILFYKGTNCAR